MRFSKYNIYIEVDKGLVIYNSKNNKYVNVFKEQEMSQIRDLLNKKILPEDNQLVQILYANGYVVQDYVDEYEEVKNSIQNYYKDNKKNLSIVLYVTDKCNFRCIYCPQEHNPSTFSSENWNALNKYIEKNVANKNIQKLYISFFGGEPLLQANQIIQFLEKVNKLRKKYTDFIFEGNITTNGYLLKPELYDKFSSLGIKYYQVTVDGFADSHNKSRVLADGSPTWDVIINNLDYINSVDDSIKVRFRVNVNQNNFNSIDDFLVWADKKFYRKNKFYFGVRPVSKFNENVDDELVYDEDSYDEIAQINAKSDRVLNKRAKVLTPLGQTCRFAENYITISADGDLYKCEYQYFDEVKPVGYLSKDGDFVFNDSYKNWTENFELDKCKTCIIYPLCAARACPKNKVILPKQRPDCYIMDGDAKELVTDMIRSGYLSEEHISKIV